MTTKDAELSKWMTVPKNLHVLAVDGDPDSLKSLVALLLNCKYNVSAIGNPFVALRYLKENKGNVDILIMDSTMQEIDGITLMKMAMQEIKDLPVILLSSRWDDEETMKGILNGAKDYLVNPPPVEVIRMIWQHVIRRRMKATNQKMESDSDVLQADSINWEDFLVFDEKEDTETSIEQAQEVIVPEIEVERDVKKPSNNSRIHWNQRLQEKFLYAFQNLGIKATPKRIQEMMGEPKLTRAQIASHLQKFRNSMKQKHLQQEMVLEAQRRQMMFLEQQQWQGLPLQTQHNLILPNQHRIGALEMGIYQNANVSSDTMFWNQI